LTECQSIPLCGAIDSIDESGWHGSCEGFPETWLLRGQERTGDKYMTDTIETDVLIIGEGSAGQAAALTAREAGARVTLLYSGQASATAISTGFLTFAAHEGFPQSEVLKMMSDSIGKGLCDMGLLRRLVHDAPREMHEIIGACDIPVDRAPRGYRVRRSTGQSGKDLLSSDYGLDGARDMTGLMMEFSSTHGTALFSQLRKAVRAADINRIRGIALSLLPNGSGAWAAIDGSLVKISSRATILATGGVQGIYDFTDTPANLVGDGQSMALEVGAELVDMEFVQFYPLAVREESTPTLFLYPDYPDSAKLINSKGENVIDKYDASSGGTLAGLHNWDQLSFYIQSEIVAGLEVFVDFRSTTDADWAPDSLTASFLPRYFRDYRSKPIRVAPSSHFTVGGIRTDIDGQTRVRGLYACGEVAGGVHGANRHGGVALVEAITFGRIAGRHAAQNLQPASTAIASLTDTPLLTAKGTAPEVKAEFDTVRQVNQRGLGAFRTAALLEETRKKLTAVRETAETFGWDGIEQYTKVMQLRRVARLSEAMEMVMSRRTESRGVHARADFPEMDPRWIRKQTLALDAKGRLQVDDVKLTAAEAIL
jgi:succinate dehydrogenase / fumarate reductase flavoprotein subunit